jgi:hypothetical protein
MSDLQQGARSVAFVQPMLIPDFVNILPTKDLQVELLEGLLNNHLDYMKKSGSLNQYDLNVFREGLSKTMLDKNQQNLVMHKIREALSK